MGKSKIEELVEKAKKIKMNIIFYPIVWGMEDFNKKYHTNCKTIEDVKVLADKWYIEYIKKNL